MKIIGFYGNSARRGGSVVSVGRFGSVGVGSIGSGAGRSGGLSALAGFVFGKVINNSRKAVSFALLAAFFVFAIGFSLFGNHNGEYVEANAAAAVPRNPHTPHGGRSVIIDAGHGGMDGGAVGVSGTVEKGINLAIAKNLKAMLEFSGYTVIMTRIGDDSIHDEGVTGVSAQKKSDMANRKKIIDDNPDSIFISIHQNRFTDPVYFGGQMFYMEENPLNRDLADIMQKKFAALQQGNDRDIKVSDGMFLLRGAKQPAILAECGFLSNPNDEAKLNDAEYQQRVAFALYSGVTEFYDTVMMSGAGDTQTPPPLITGSGTAGDDYDGGTYDGGYMGGNAT